MDKQDLINNLATAYTKLVWEQIGSASYVMALKSNGIEVTEERTKWHTIMLNRELDNVYKILRALGVRGKTPVRQFDAKVKCTSSCKNAKGMDCRCSCAGIFHSLSNVTLLRS